MIKFVVAAAIVIASVSSVFADEAKTQKMAVWNDHCPYSYSFKDDGRCLTVKEAELRVRKGSGIVTVLKAKPHAVVFGYFIGDYIIAN